MDRPDTAGEPRDRPRVPLPRRWWHGVLWCHVPADRPVRLASLAEAEGNADRWNDPGRPTAYLACDAGVATAEYGRHHDPGAGADERRLLRLEVAIPGLVDLRDEAVLRALGIEGAPAAFLDRELARSTARRIRDEEGAAGLVVTSAAFLDRPDRCNVVVFADAVPGGIEGIVTRWTDGGRLSLVGDPAAASPGARP